MKRLPAIAGDRPFAPSSALGFLYIALGGWALLQVMLILWQDLTDRAQWAVQALTGLGAADALTWSYILRGLLLSVLFFVVMLAAWTIRTRELRRTLANKQDSEERYRLALEVAHTGIYEWNAETDLVEFSERCWTMFALDRTRGPMTGQWWTSLIHEDDRHAYRAAFVEHTKGKRPIFDLEYRVCPTDTEIVWVRDRHVAKRDGKGRLLRLNGSMEDITERKQRDNALVESEAFTRLIADNVPAWICYVDRELRYRFVNARYEEELGISKQQLLGLSMWDGPGKEHKGRILPKIERALSGEACQLEAEFDMFGQGKRWFRTQYVPHIVGDTVHGVFILRQDITAQKESQHEAVEQAEQIEKIANGVPAVITYIDRDYRFRFANKNAQRWYARPVSDIVGRTAAEVLGEALFSRFKPGFDEVFSGTPVSFSDEVLYPDGARRRVSVYWEPDMRQDGVVRGLYGFVVDTTRQAELEETIRQTQKLEALGQLTGGIAHDFNNLLLAIDANLELAKLEIEDGSGISNAVRFMEGARKAVDRATKLTGRLLAFSRRQPLKPKVVEVAPFLHEFADALDRMVGGNIEIRVADADPTLCIRADPSELENALLNLSINARDAMPDGGHIVLSANARDLDARIGRGGRPPGAYVCIHVSDSGTGMTDEVRGKVFEPFFTTKETGRGTGLGLSMVHGFVQQSDGFAEIESTPGAGTTVSLCFPCAEGDAEYDTVAPPTTRAESGAGTILLVEDDDLVRETTAASLAKLGYQVVTAARGLEARNIVDRRDDIDLVFSDIVMPGEVNGLALARYIREHRPGLRVLLASGYSADALRSQAAEGIDAEILKKPFDRTQLASAVRSAMAA